MIRSLVYCLIVLVSTSIASAADNEWQNLIEEFKPDTQQVAGTWEVDEQSLLTNATGGSRIMFPVQPKTEYDFRVSFTRNTGQHSIALIFVSGGGQATYEVDAWGEHLSGIQMIAGRGIRDNSTRKNNQQLENGRRYTMRVEVRKDQVKAYLDDQLLAVHKTDGSDLSMHSIWQVPEKASLGIGAHASETTFHSVEFRNVSETSLASSENNVASRSNPAGTRPAAEMRNNPTQKQPQSKSTGKRVLLVIANQHFFYREYADPKEELERAGIQVDVAAGTKTICRPHRNSGEHGSGEVMPDLTIADANADDYDAIMFSGGWGSSMYQYSFSGQYSNRVYNGNPQVKAAVNRLLNDFIRQDKIVGALCHGVSVLAWARVNGKSILYGKKAVGSPRNSPAGSYPGLNQVPLSRWNAEANGARLTPIRSIGDPRTSADDVMVDGKIITGEDDNSARLFGRTLATIVNGS